MTTQKAPKRYVPDTEELNREFFVASASGTLHLQRCDDCGTYTHPARYYCPACYSDQWRWVPSEGVGKVASWVTTHMSIDRGWVDVAPYTTVAVELEEGPRILGSLRGIDVDELRTGLPCRLVGEPQGDEFVFFWVDPLDG